MPVFAEACGGGRTRGEEGIAADHRKPAEESLFYWMEGVIPMELSLVLMAGMGRLLTRLRDGDGRGWWKMGKEIALLSYNYKPQTMTIKIR